MRVNYNDKLQRLVLVPENNDDKHFCNKMWNRLDVGDEWMVWNGDVEEDHWRDENGELEMLFGDKYQLKKIGMVEDEDRTL
tara:strand:- start:1556 stop:1798 length:243 start_codon:yes stop_codon:yes gene_type:complete